MTIHRSNIRRPFKIQCVGCFNWFREEQVTNHKDLCFCVLCVPLAQDQDKKRVHRDESGVLHLHRPDHYVEIIVDALGTAIEDGYDHNEIFAAALWQLATTTSSEGSEVDQPLDIERG